MTTNREALGPAEAIIQAVSTHIGHMHHGRTGVLTRSFSNPTGWDWTYAVTKEEKGITQVYAPSKTKGFKPRLLGPLVNGNVREAVWAPTGLVEPVAVWLWEQVATVYGMSPELVAQWASWAWKEPNKDLKVLLAAFLLVQEASGAPVYDPNGNIEFYSDDFRATGEAMALIVGNNNINPNYIFRMVEVLELPGIAAINRRLGFGVSLREPPLGRWPRMVEKYLKHLEMSPKLFDGLIRAGFASSIRRLAKKVGYKPISETFFVKTKWKQKQSGAGHRTLGLNLTIVKDSWDGLTELEICEQIEKTKPKFLTVTSKVPAAIGMTRAIVSCVVENGGMSDRDLIQYSPMLESLGLLEDNDIRTRWEKALKQADNRRAERVSERLVKTENKEKLVEAAEKASEKALANATRGLRVYVAVDISGSMSNSIETAKTFLAQLLTGFPLDRTHVCIFNTIALPVRLEGNTKQAIAKSFHGIRASGGTEHETALDFFARHHPPKEDEDVLVIWVGDEEQSRYGNITAPWVAQLRPSAFAMLRVRVSGVSWVRDTANGLRIPFFDVSLGMFDDAYATTSTLTNLIRSTPVGSARNTPNRVVTRLSLLDEILKTPVLTRPQWAGG